jgi:uncharacterized surface protein with fasciclin (FAS1) repeats
MKKLFKTFAFLALCSFTVSCSNDSSSSSSPGTIAEIASSNANLSTLVSALNKTGLTSTFNSAGDFTVFAPTNDKFDAFLAANGFADLDAVPVSVLTEILKNHVVTGSFYSDELTTGYVKTLAKGAASSTNTLSMFVEVGSTVKLNGGAANGGATVVTADIEASNGVIHIVDNVIGLPTVVNHAIANPNFTTLVGLVSDAGLVPTLNGTEGSPFTVFAPTNTAFTTFESQNPGVLGGLDATQVISVLTYHVVGGANALSNAIPTTAITTLESGTFTIAGTTITDEQNRATGIVVVDVQASNGVIHAINNVLLPTL